MIDVHNLPKEIQVKLDLLTKQEQLEVYRELALDDLFFFAENILGYKGLNRTLHGELCDFLMDWRPEKSTKLVLVSRGHLKSTIGTVAFCIWQIIKNPNIRILLASGKLDNAQAFLREIKGHFEKNDTFMAMFPEVIPPDLRRTIWTNSEMLVPRKINYKEATIELSSVDSDVTSKHYDLIVADDLVNRDNTSTPEQQEKVRYWFAASQPMLEANGRYLLIGTRWSFFDLYGSLLENDQSVDPFIRGVYNDDGSLAFPEKYTREYLEATRQKIVATYGEGLWRAQYFNEILDEATADFPRKRKEQEGFWYDSVPEGAAYSIAIDPAISEAAGSADTGITVVARDTADDWYVDYVVKGKFDPLEIIERVCELILTMREQHKKLDGITVETIAYQKSLRFYMEDEFRRRGIHIPFNDMPADAHQKSKEMRIRGLSPLYKSGKLKFRRKDNGDMEALLMQMWQFPKSSKVDLVDSLSFHQYIRVYPITARSLVTKPIHDRRVMTRTIHKPNTNLRYRG